MKLNHSGNNNLYNYYYNIGGIAMNIMSRESLGEVKAKSLRKKGLIPGVLYSKSMEPIEIAVDEKEFKKVYKDNKETGVFDINLNNENHTVFIQEVQRQILDNGEFTHFDLHKVTENDIIHTHVPVVLMNKRAIEGQGLIVQQQLMDVEVKYSMHNSTSQIGIDISNLTNGDYLTVADLQIPQGISVLDDANAIIASVSYPRFSDAIEASEQEGLS